MNTENTTVPAIDSSLEILSEDLDSFKSETEDKEQPEHLILTSKPVPVTSPESNAFNKAAGITSDIDSSLEILSEDLDSFKSETEDKEQHEHLILTSKPVPVTSPESNAFNKAAGITSDEEFFNISQLLRKHLLQYFSEAYRNTSVILDIKKNCTNFLNETYCLTSEDKDKIATLKSRIASYQQTVFHEKSNPIVVELGETLDRISSYIDEDPSADYLYDTLKIFEFDLKGSTMAFNDIRNTTRSICEEVEVLLDSMLSELSRIEKS